MSGPMQFYNIRRQPFRFIAFLFHCLLRQPDKQISSGDLQAAGSSFGRQIEIPRGKTRQGSILSIGATKIRTQHSAQKHHLKATLKNRKKNSLLSIFNYCFYLFDYFS